MTAALALVTAPQAPSLTKQAILAAFDTTKSQMDDLLAAIQTLDVEHKGCNCGEIAIGQLEIDMVEVREKRNIVEVVYDWLLACTVDCDPSTPLFFPALDFLTMMTIAEPRSAYDAQEAPKVKMMVRRNGWTITNRSFPMDPFKWMAVWLVSNTDDFAA